MARFDGKHRRSRHQGLTKIDGHPQRSALGGFLCHLKVKQGWLCTQVSAGFITAFFNEKKQGWHDSMANTVVVDTRA